MPQVKETVMAYRSRLMDSDVLERLAVKMHVRGSSPRDIEDALVVATGTRLLSRTAASELTDPL